MSKQPSTPRGREPMISWSQNFESKGFYCTVSIPQSWMMEASHFKRKLQLWWWLTRLAWSIPK